MNECKWYQDDFCVNADCPLVADFCPVVDVPGVCKYEERSQDEREGEKGSRQHHYLKILPKHYRAVEEGIKTFEIRFNDRDFKFGDILHLQEHCGGQYTGREIEKEVCYVIDDLEYCKEGFIVLGIRDI